MRRRLLLVLLVLSAAAVAGFAWPLLSSTAAARTQELVIARTADLDRFAVLAQQGADSTALAAELTAYTELYGDAVVVVDARRHPVAEAGGLRAADPAVAPYLDAALRNQPARPVEQLRPWSSGDVVLARPVGTGTRVGGAVVLRASVGAAVADVRRSWLVIALGALAAAAGFVLLAFAVSRWVLRPLAQLDDGVRAVAAGRRRTHVPGDAGPKELRTLAASFNTMSDAVAEAAEQQQQLVADASHQLRNPMTALRLRVDSLAMRMPGGDRSAYDSMVTEVERLESLLSGLLALAVADSTAARLTAAGDTGCDAVAVAHDRVDSWRPSASRAGVVLTGPDTHDPLPVDCPESELAQVFDVLLDNAIKYGGRGTRVEVSAVPEGVVVRDDGPGLTEAELANATGRFWRAERDQSTDGTGLGLAIAEKLVVGRGGRLAIARVHPHGLAVHVTLPGSS